MLIASQILVRTLVPMAVAAVLSGCGQSGPLYLPTAPEAAQRATLPQTLAPGLAREPAPGSAQPPASGASAPR
nr:lipoprotein [uncultured Acidovorax sp.]